MKLRILIYALLHVTLSQVPAPGQPTQTQPAPAAADDTRTLPKWKPAARKKTVRPDVARYSPLAAAGGYQGQTRTWYDALFERLNPEGIDWGAVFEQRKANFRENMLYNRYFWYCVSLTLFSLLALFGWQVAVSDKRIILREAERQVDMLVHETEYCRKKALEAITRYNTHVEKCNLVAEAMVAGTPAPGMSDYAQLKQQHEKAELERRDKVLELARVTSELEKEKQCSRGLTVRIEELERRHKDQEERGSESSNSGLVQRISRLEQDLERARGENRELRAVLKRKPGAEAAN